MIVSICIYSFKLYCVLTFILAFMLILRWNTKQVLCYCMYLNNLVLNKSVKRNNEF